MAKPNGTESMDDALALFNPELVKQLRGMSDIAKREEAAEKREQAMLELITEFKQALVDMAEGNDPQALADKLGAAMTSAMVAALKAMPAPQLTSAPVTMECTIPPPPAPVLLPIERTLGDETWEIRIKGQFGGADKVMTVTRKGQKAEPKRVVQ